MQKLNYLYVNYTNILENIFIKWCTVLKICEKGNSLDLKLCSSYDFQWIIIRIVYFILKIYIKHGLKFCNNWNIIFIVMTFFPIKFYKKEKKNI